MFLLYHEDNELKPSSFESFEQFYKNGHVTFIDGSKHLVKSVIYRNRNMFEIDVGELDNIQNSTDDNGVMV